MANSRTEEQRNYRQRVKFRIEPMLCPAVMHAYMNISEREGQRRWHIVRHYGQYPAPERAMRIPLSDAERQRRYRERNKFKVAAAKVERLNREQSQFIDSLHISDTHITPK
jgi:hypothetical protein